MLSEAKAEFFRTLEEGFFKKKTQAFCDKF